MKGRHVNADNLPLTLNQLIHPWPTLPSPSRFIDEPRHEVSMYVAEQYKSLRHTR